MSKKNKDVHSILGKRLGILRTQRKLTLTGLAEKSGISKGALSVLEDGRGNPTISTMWRLADALEIPFGELATLDDNKNSLQLEDQGISVQLIEQSSNKPLVETYLMKLAPHCTREAEPHSPGVIEKVMVLKGGLLTGNYDKPKKIFSGESYEFTGDRVHLYKSLEEPVTVIISVKYPDEKHEVDSFTKYRNIVEEHDKDGLIEFINRHIIEAINGVKAYRLIFNSNPKENDVSPYIKKGLLEIKNHEFSLPLHVFLRERSRETEVFLLPRFNSGQLMESCFLHDLYREETNNSDQSQNVKNKKKTYEEILYEWAENDSMTISTLAAEALTFRDVPSIPIAMRDSNVSRADFDNATDERSFEDRINVANYDNYELLHPGYARQAPAMAQMINSHYKKKPEQILDIGTGPGYPLFMLLEFFPDSKAIAVDPSPASCECLKQNIKEKKISLIRKDFLRLNDENISPVITSVGASHHFNTAFFFQKAKSLLQDDGLLIVADEFIPRFSCQEERNLGLIRHHVMYMLDVMTHVSSKEITGISSDETNLITSMEKELPVMIFEATTGMHESAVRRARRLLQLIHNLHLPKQPGHQYVKFYHFMVLELEALVAGIDYEVEQKTYPENVVFLADFAGLTLQEHNRVYPTIGHNSMDGGTHVFAFSKRH